ncbi:MAG: glycoside hydrolase family 15 protein [Thermoplasmata archaeon]|nr:glycoside hydrolase family 15 protein [Thermoplasmata archaeon]
MARSRRSGSPERPPARPERFPLGPPTALHDYGVIGNLRTAALVHRAGAIDWACLPRFASPSVFGRILDPLRGGTFLLRPVGAAPGFQRYRPSTNVLETVFEGTEGGTVTLVDFMPVPEGGSDEDAARIVRIVESDSAAAELEVWFEPRFEYGRVTAELELTPGGVVAESGSTAVALRGPGPFEVGHGRATASVSLAADASVAFDLSWGAAPRRGSGVRALLTQTEQFWRGWVHGPDAPLHRLAARWHEPIERSELVLKLLSNPTTGAFVAAPTTSLPEWPGGRRNWDYRYAWIRDAAFVAQEMLLLGHVPEARAFLGWVVARLGPSRRGKRADLHVLYGVHGESDLAEHRLSHLPGFLGSRPVRIGNAAYTQFQLDIYGELLDAANLLAAIDPDGIPRESLSALLDLADEVGRRWTAPDQGIWEVRGPPRHFVHSKLMAWVAMDRASHLAERYGGDRREARWRTTAEAIRAAILEHGWDERRHTFLRSFGEPGVDAANLRIPLVGFLPFDDPRVLGTVERVAADLTRGAFVWRYEASDGVGGRDGSFLPCAFWLVECRARAGQLVRARRAFAELLQSASPHGLFSEEWDPAGGGQALGNYPQAFTHVALLRAALALGLAGAGRAERARIAALAPYLPGVAGVPGAPPTPPTEPLLTRRALSRTTSRATARPPGRTPGAPRRRPRP